MGELGPCVFYSPDRDSFFELKYKPGRVLCEGSDGRCMFILLPVAEEMGKARETDHLLKATELHERFVHRESDGYYNLRIPEFVEPKYHGDLVIVRYYSDKDMSDYETGDDDEDIDEGNEEIMYEHYFEEPDTRPAYAPVYSVGHGQFIIPPGPWKITDRGIEYADPPEEKKWQVA